MRLKEVLTVGISGSNKCWAGIADANRQDETAIFQEPKKDGNESSVILISFFFEAEEDMHTANDGNKASPRFIYKLCLLLFSFPSQFRAGVGSSVPTQNSHDISHSHDLNEENRRLAGSCWCLETLPGVGCSQKGQQPKPICLD